MNQSFRLRFDEMQDSNPAGEESAMDSASENSYASHGNVRNICFNLLDGKRTFLNYAYLVSADYNPSENAVVLIFTSHLVMLKGVKLELLFDEVMQQLPKIIICSHIRYNQTIADEHYIVNEIIIAEKK